MNPPTGSTRRGRRPPGLGDRYVVVLCETQDLVNIAGTARAMMNMGATRLRLVRPVEYDERRITGIAHGSEPLLERIEFFETLEQATVDAAQVVGTSARGRTSAFVWQQPRDAAPELHGLAALDNGPVALVFGREDKGLSNEQLDLCDRVLQIPTAPENSSLNLAQAALLILYELFMAGAGAEAPLPSHRRVRPPATTEQTRSLFEDVAKTLQTIDFYKKRNPDAILRTLRNLARRAELDSREANLLRAMAIEVRNHLARQLER